MAYLGRFELVVTDTSGNAKNGASVTLKKRGATVNGAQSTVSTVNVHDPGGIVAGDTVSVNGTGVGISVNSVTSTTVVLATASSFADGDRLSPNNPPTLYTASDGGTSKSNPLTTDANGIAFAYVVGGQYDALVSHADLTTTLRHDIGVVADNVLGPELVTPPFVYDTLRTIASTDKVFSIRNATTERWYVRGDGKQGATTLVGALTIDSGGATITSGGLTVTAGGINVVAGGLEVEGDATLHDSLLVGPVGSVDCNLYRNAANELKTDDSLIIAKNLTVTGYTLLTVPTEITVSSATLTLPATGTAFVVTAGSAQTVTAISGATAGQLLVFSAKSGTSPITFSGANFFFGSAAAILDDTVASNTTPGMIFWYDGSVFRHIASAKG